MVGLLLEVGSGNRERRMACNNKPLLCFWETFLVVDVLGKQTFNRDDT